MRRFASLAVFVLLAGCVEETPPVVEADDFILPLTKASLDGEWTATLVEANPSPPARGNSNRWRFELSDVDGEPMDDLNLKVRLFMPQHNHGTSAPVITTTDVAGEYEVSRINFIMGGVWEARVYAEGQPPARDVLFYVNVPD